MPNLLTPTFRGSFVTLITPKAIKGGKPAYSMEAVLPKNDPKTKAFMRLLETAFTEATTAKFGKPVAKAALKHYPVLDGDAAVNKDGDPREETAGCWILRLKNEDQPGILVLDKDGTKREMTSAKEIYSGAFYCASVQPYAWSNEFGKGVSISLQGVLKMKDGDKIGGSRFSASDFDGVETESEAEAEL